MLALLALHPAPHPDPSRRRNRRSTLVAFVLIALLGGVAQSQPSSDQMAQAQALFDEGIRLFNVGRFEEACPKFEASLGLVAGIGTRGKLAECYEELGKTASAWRLYREVARLSRRTNDTLRERVAAERVRALEPRLGRLTIRPGPSVTVQGFEVRSNGHTVEPRIFDSEQIVDPGTYIIVVSAPGHALWSSAIRVGEGKRAVMEIGALQVMDDAGQDTSSPEPLRIAAYSLMGVGLVSALGGGTYFGVKASDKWDEAFDRGYCDRVTLECDEVGLALAREANRNANFANITVGVGVVAAAAGAVLWWRTREAPDKGTQQAVTVSPSLLPQGMGLVLSRRF
jgi:hypothetical protein